MRNYIKLLSVALLVSGATQVNAATDPIAMGLSAAGYRSATLNGAQVAAVFGELPDGTQLNSFRSKLRAYEESRAPAAHVAAPAGNVVALVGLGLSAKAAAFVDTLEEATVGAKITGLPAIDFSAGRAAATGAAYSSTLTALAAVPGFSALKQGNQAYFAATLKALFDAKDDITMAIAESARSGALSAASRTLAGDIALVPQGDAKADPAKVLANLFEREYNRSGVQTPNPGAAGWLDTIALPAHIKAELEKETTWTAILAAVK